MQMVEIFYVKLVLRKQTILQKLTLIKEFFFEHGNFPMVDGLLSGVVFEKWNRLKLFVFEHVLSQLFNSEKLTV
jgi:hypothetical protein